MTAPSSDAERPTLLELAIEHLERWSTTSPIHDPLAMHALLHMMSAR